MKTAKQWMDLMPESLDNDGGVSRYCDETFIKEIQFDAYKAGLFDAADEVEVYGNKNIIEVCKRIKSDSENLTLESL